MLSILTTTIIVIALFAIIIIAMPAYIFVILGTALQFMIIWLIANAICRICFKTSLILVLSKIIDKLK